MIAGDSEHKPVVTRKMDDGRTIHYFGQPAENSPNSPVSVITGGLGYIGQSLAYYLSSRGQPVIVVDRRNIPSQLSNITVIRGSVGESEVWEWIRAHFEIQTVYHCAGLISVSESVAEPAPYFRENVVEAVRMLDHLRLGPPVPLVFSSSAAVYGTPTSVPIDESAEKRPMSPYGITKWQFEQVLEAYEAAYHLPWVALRYFNAAGQLGPVREMHQPETHVLPRMAQAIRQGTSPVVFGADYPTPDGSAIRDYVHIADLAEAHRLAAEYLRAGGTPGAFNLGSGTGTSVLELVEAFGRVSGQPVHPEVQGRRPGDPPRLVAAISRVAEVLGWQPRNSHPVDAMVRDAWQASGVETADA